MGGYEQIGLWLVRALSFLGVYVSSLACMVLISAAAPGFLSRVVSEARSGMRRCFLWGIVFTVNLILLADCANLNLLFDCANLKLLADCANLTLLADCANLNVTD